MATITTKLVKDGNSMAVRLPKTVLTMSGLHGTVRLDVKRGQITMHAASNPREGWKEQIRKEIKNNGPLSIVDEYGDLMAEIDTTISDGLDEQ